MVARKGGAVTNSFARDVFGDLLCDEAVAGAFSAAAFTDRMLSFEAAWTGALADVGAVSGRDAEAAMAAIKSFRQTHFHAGSLADGVPVPGLVRALRFGLDQAAARAIHTGATSQDVIDSAMALTLIAVHGEIRDRLARISHLLEELRLRHGKKPLMARTRMQAAMPATADLRIAAWRRAIDGQIARAGAARAEIATVQIGGPIGRRDAPPGQASEVARRVADALGLTLGPVWHTDRSGPVSFGHWLTLVSGTLGKIGQDIALMAQQGVDEIALRGGGGSSSMPEKQNPVAAEAMVALARFTAVQQATLAQAMIHEQERSGAAWMLEWLTLPAMAEATGASLNHCLTLLERIDWIAEPD